MMTMTTMMKTTVRFSSVLGFCEYFNSFAEVFKGSNLPFHLSLHFHVDSIRIG